MLSTLARDTVTELGEATALPRADAATVRALNRLYASAASHAVAARGVGYQLAWQVDEATEAAVCERYRFKLGAHVGHLGLDAPSIEALLGERRCDLLPRDLRYILLADALHLLVDALEKALRLHFEWQPPDTDSREPRGERQEPQHTLHTACFVATSAGERASLRGFVQFDNSATLDSLVPASHGAAPRHARAGFEHLRLPLSFCLGHTPIRLREVASIRAGDIVSIEHWSSKGAGIVVDAELGGAVGRQLIGLAEGSRITVQQWKDSAMNRDMPLASNIGTAAAPSDAGNAASLPIDRLDALEVTLRFEVGELSLSLGELKSIRAGHVFELGQALNRSPVRILAHGNVLGKGHLVAVGDRLGVRVSEFAPNEI